MDRAFGGLGWQIVGWLVDAAGAPASENVGATEPSKAIYATDMICKCKKAYLFCAIFHGARTCVEA